MKIGEAAKETGLSVSNIRFYEKKGLLNPRRREESQYREYGQEEVRRLKEIMLLRKLGISIESIYLLYNGQAEYQGAAPAPEGRRCRSRWRCSEALWSCAGFWKGRERSRNWMWINGCSGSAERKRAGRNSQQLRNFWRTWQNFPDWRLFGMIRTWAVSSGKEAAQGCWRFFFFLFLLAAVALIRGYHEVFA